MTSSFPPLEDFVEAVRGRRVRLRSSPDPALRDLVGRVGEIRDIRPPDRLVLRFRDREVTVRLGRDRLMRA